MTYNFINFLKERISDRVIELLKLAFSLDSVSADSFKFETPPDGKMGHIAFACFPLAKVVKKAPPMIAQAIAEHWGDDQHFETVEAQGPYLNFKIAGTWLANAMLPVCIEEEKYGKNDSGQGQTLMLEYSSPNTNKPLHLGHGRNNLLGITLARLLEYSNYNLVKANLVNDRGIHICKSMLAYQKWGEGKTPESTGKKGDKFVGDFYVLYAQKEKEHPELLEEAQQMLRDWEAENPEVRALWKTMNKWVIDGFRETYERMGVSFDRYYFESETFTGGKELVNAALEKGICYREENGAIAIDLEAEKLGKKILLRGDGTSVYMTQDISTTVKKFEDYEDRHLNGCLFVVGNEQDNHFNVLFKTLEKFGYDWANRCEHISYGMITLPEGRMKSREGTVVDLDDLMDEMKSLALEQAKERSAIQGRSEEELLQVAEEVGQAAIKYYILRTNAVKSISFNPKESLSFEGQTGPYLQYTHARICSLLKKAEQKPSDIYLGRYQWNQDEVRVLVQLARFPDFVEESAKQRNPAVLAGYIYDLCRGFNKFYYDNKILTAESTEAVQARLCLSLGTKEVLRKTLDILGIAAIKRM
ncbi:MAG: arginyl-tRNA synthetase [bacterium]|jgi:arginyl-tRNA synthetase